MKMESRSRLVNDFVASINILLSGIDELIQNRFFKEVTEAVSFSQLKVLMLIARTKGGTITNVATYLRISLPAASKSVNKLVQQNLIQRTSHGDDRRKNELVLTREGETLLSRYYAIQTEALNELFSAIPDESMTNITSQLDQMATSLRNHQDAPKELCYRCGVYFRNKCLRREDENCSCYPHPFSFDENAKEKETCNQ